MKKEEEYCCEDLPWYMSCQGFSECLSWAEEDLVRWLQLSKKGPEWISAADGDNSVRQALGDVYHFLVIEDRNVRSGKESMFDEPPCYFHVEVIFKYF